MYMCCQVKCAYNLGCELSGGLTDIPGITARANKSI